MTGLGACRCQGSRKLAVSSQVSNITLLAVYVDMGTREVVGYGVSTPDDEEPGLRGNVDPVFSPRILLQVYDYKSGEKVYDGKRENMGRISPFGKSDD